MYKEIFDNFHLKLIQLRMLSDIKAAMCRNNLLVYGEIHGIQENADVVYSLCKQLDIKHLAIECPNSVSDFIESGVRGDIDFSLVDCDIFESSILSIEMTNAIVALLRDKVIEKITYIDTYYNEYCDGDSPDAERREQILADNIVNLDLNLPTLCIMGRWHTQVNPVDGHVSALYRSRQKNPGIISVQMVYGGGELYNDREVLILPDSAEKLVDYSLSKISELDFELFVPTAHKISVPSDTSKL